MSLSDSRNQLKVKIKGPFLDANYAASNTPLPAPPPAQATTPAATINAAVTGTSSLRRMRKKELLRQYCNQDMNTEYPAAPITPAAPPPSRSCITIPKAVASMTSIPTREDYKALIDANMDKKRKKEKPVSTAYYSLEKNCQSCTLTRGVIFRQGFLERLISPSRPPTTTTLAFQRGEHPQEAPLR